MENVLKSSGLVLVNSSNYNQWQYEQFKPYIGKTVLEIGCGLGNLTQFIIKDTNFLLSTDTQPEAVTYIRSRCPETDHFKIEQRDIFQDGLGAYATQTFDTIVFSNVLEHIKDDQRAMNICHDILKESRGKLLLLVPAHSFLYGTLDQESGHYRRYSKQNIIHLAHSAGFAVRDLYAFNLTGAAGWFVNYCLLKRKGSNNSTDDGQVGFYDRFLVKPSRLMERIVRPPVGISYIAILEANP